MKIKEESRKKVNSEFIDSRLQELLHMLLSNKHVIHAIVAVERGDHSFKWIGAVGDADQAGNPMRTDTAFFIASVTKLYIAAVVLKLHEQGLLNLDLPISAYLPQSVITGVHRFGGNDFTDTITIEHLLSHTSGLADWGEDRPKGGQSVIAQLVRDGDRAFCIADITRIVREELTPHFPPQSLNAKRPQVRYSDTNYQLLIAIIETVAGQPLHQVFDQELFQPLNLNHTFNAGYPSRAVSTNPATLWAGSQPLNLPLALQSLGDLYSTASDMLTFMRALTQGRIFDNPQTYNLMQRRWLRFGFPLDPAALRAPGWPIEYGFGLMRFRLPRLFTLPHKLPAVLGHTGSTGSWLFHCPELDLYLCGTVDQVSAGAVPYRIVPKLLEVCTALDQ